MTRPLNRSVATFVVLAAICALACVTPLAAQNAQLSGVVRDIQGAVVPGATITITNEDKGVSQTVRTNPEGYYVAPFLAPGMYAISAKAKGFQTVVSNHFKLEVGQSALLDFKLQVGTVEQSVNVEGGVPLVNTESAVVATVVDQQFVEKIPLNGRSFQSLIALTPGIVTIPTTFNPAASSNVSGQFSVNGQRTDSNVYMVDGVSANFGASAGGALGAQTSGNLPGLSTFGSTQSLVSVDALQEFKVQTSSYSAENGRQPGAQISIATRSGTNHFHGTAFEYVRNDIFDANDWFANRAGQPKAPERQNDYGGTFGGPVLLPGYNGHDKTFFFFSYEGLQLRLPLFTVWNVPTTTIRQNAAAALRPFLNAFPIPLPGARDLGNGQAEFSAAYSNPSSLNASSLRLDHAFSNKVTAFVRYNYAPSATTSRQVAGGGSQLVDSRITAQTLTGGVTASLSPTISNDFRVNLSNNKATNHNILDDFGGAVPNDVTNLIPAEYRTGRAQFGGRLNFSVFTGAGRTSISVFTQPLVYSQRQFNILDSISYGHGPHRFKAGFDFRRLTPSYDPNAYAFIPVFANSTQVLNGIAGTATVTAATSARPIYSNFSLWGQDTWRVTQRLTLDLGLRWDANPAPGERSSNHPLALTSISNLATMQLAPNGAPLWDTTLGNFAPRIGVAYALRNHRGLETVLRGGFGVFFDSGNNLGSNGFNNYPFVIVKSLTNVAFPLNPTIVAPPPLPSLATLPTLTTPYGTIAAFDPKLRLPYTNQWNVAVEQALGSPNVVTVSYVGAIGRSLLQQRQLSLAAINPKFTTVKLTTNHSTSDYHALQTQFRRRMSHGLQALVSYTWSHALDEDSIDNGTIIPIRGNASFDVRHNFTAALTYNIPSPSQDRVVKAIFGSWEVDGTARAQTALPVDITGSQTVNPADGSLVAARANLVAGAPLYIYDSTLPGGRKINRAAFTVPATGTFGNLGRNVVRGLPVSQVDAALQRQFNITERINLLFRAEGFNLLNHPNFGGIQTILTAADFGQSTSMLNQNIGGLSPLYQGGGPRSFQFALKLRF